jgi:hypothetical protein
VPLLTVTEPVGVGLPDPPFTATVTWSDWAVVTWEYAGVTVTVGVIREASTVTVTMLEVDDG